jgi:hypothetical protein
VRQDLGEHRAHLLLSHQLQPAEHGLQPGLRQGEQGAAEPHDATQHGAEEGQEGGHAGREQGQQQLVARQLQLLGEAGLVGQHLCEEADDDPLCLGAMVPALPHQQQGQLVLGGHFRVSGGPERHLPPQPWGPGVQQAGPKGRALPDSYSRFASTVWSFTFLATLLMPPTSAL